MHYGACVPHWLSRYISSEVSRVRLPSSCNVGPWASPELTIACGASAWNSGTVSVLCRVHLRVVVDLKRPYRNGLNEWRRGKCINCVEIGGKLHIWSQWLKKGHQKFWWINIETFLKKRNLGKKIFIESNRGSEIGGKSETGWKCIIGLGWKDAPKHPKNV